VNSEFLGITSFSDFQHLFQKIEKDIFSRFLELARNLENIKILGILKFLGFLGFLGILSPRNE
jgi:hypothetical protein